MPGKKKPVFVDEFEYKGRHCKIEESTCRDGSKIYWAQRFVDGFNSEGLGPFYEVDKCRDGVKPHIDKGYNWK
jgi:hypothetical protein